MSKPWVFIGNPFESSTRTSHVRMLSIATDTDSKLESKLPDPDIQIIYNDYHPVFVIYRQICQNYDIAAGNRKGETLNVKTLLSVDLKEQLPLWEAKVRSVYPEGSPAETAYFPQHRTPFYDGTYEDRIGTVGALATKLSQDPDGTLQAYSATVFSFYNLLLAARNTQQMKEGVLEGLSTTREAQRVLVARQLYAALARLMYKYRDNTEQITEFFDLSLIRHTDESHTIIIKGRVTSGLGDPVDATVAVQGENPPPQITETDYEGNYMFKFKNVPASEIGEVTFTVTAQGFQPHQESFNVELGGTYTINVTMTQQMQIAA